MEQKQLQLPCEPKLLCQDRFDVCETNEDEVPFWKLFEAIVEIPISTIDGLINFLETIAISIHGTAGTDYGILREAFTEYWDNQSPNFFTRIWPIIKDLALELPSLFEANALDYLTQKNPRIVFSRRQVACLVVHQFFCTLHKPPWMTDGSPDFHIWYGSSTPHPKAVKAYLFALFRYFQLLADDSDVSPLRHDVADWPIVLALQRLTTVAWNRAMEQANSKVAPLEVIHIANASTVIKNDRHMGLPNGTAVIFANKDVGFGRTASQEEMIVGCSPEICIAVLFQPTMADEEVLVVEGAQALISISGFARDAQFHSYLKPDYDRVTWRQSKWRKRTVLFMDALELDSYDSSSLVPDVLPGNVDRELRKAYTAFSYLSRNNELMESAVTGFWGCRSFGGNKEIKTLIQWTAASMANIRLLFLCHGDDTLAFADNLRYLVQFSRNRRCGVDQVFGFLQSLQPRSEAARDAFSFFERRCLIASQ